MENSKKIFIWFNTLVRKPKGLPHIDNIWISENYTPNKKPESMNYEWMNYNSYTDGFPPINSKLRLPGKLYFIIQETKILSFDWMAFNQNIMIVSENFLSFLKEHMREECFETSTLTTVSKNSKELELKAQYYAIRIGKYNDNLFNISEKGKKRAAGLRDTFLYPNISLKEQAKDGIFFLDEFCYLEALIITEPMKEKIKRDFYSPELYKIEDFPAVYNNRLYSDKLPDME